MVDYNTEALLITETIRRAPEDAGRFRKQGISRDPFQGAIGIYRDKRQR